jgi:1,4-alpha-glucan branching enzyme
MTQLNRARGYWYADISSAAIGDEYRYRIVSGDKQLLRLDPCYLPLPPKQPFPTRNVSQPPVAARWRFASTLEGVNL